MSDAQRLVDQWASKPPGDAHKREVFKVLDEYFRGQWRQGGKSSHIVVSHPKLQGQPLYGPGGQFTIIVKEGQRVKGFYLKNLAKTIKLIEALQEEEKGVERA